MSAPTVLIATLKLRPGHEDAFDAWSVKHDQAVARFPGFISSDTIPPVKKDGNEWTVLLNFRSQEELVTWQRSSERAQVLGEVLPLLEGGSLGEIMPKDNSAEQPETVVTQVIISKVKAGMEEQYRAWAARIQRAQAKYPGYRGAYVQPPTPGTGSRWTTMLRFDSADHLEAWLAAPERAELVRESKAFIEDEELFRLATSFPGWVPIDPATGKGPPDWKTAMLVLLGLYPVVMLEFRFLNPQLAFLNQATAVFLGNVLSVCVTSFVTMPLFVRWFNWWLFAKRSAPAGATSKGVVIIIVLFVLEIVLLHTVL